MALHACVHGITCMHSWPYMHARLRVLRRRYVSVMLCSSYMLQAHCGRCWQQLRQRSGPAYSNLHYADAKVRAQLSSCPDSPEEIEAVIFDLDENCRAYCCSLLLAKHASLVPRLNSSRASACLPGCCEQLYLRVIIFLQVFCCPDLVTSCESALA
eukprot:4339429-Pleurochrysis_carterae.AAC.2